MRKHLLGACIQAVVIALIIGSICYLVRGDFLYRYLAVIFGFFAGLAYFITGKVIHFLHEIKQIETKE